MNSKYFIINKLFVFLFLCCRLVCLGQTEFAFPFQDSGNGVPEGWQLSKPSGQCSVQDGVVSIAGQSTGDLYLLHPITLEKDVTYTLQGEARCQPGGDYMIYYEYWLGDKFESHIWRSQGTGDWEEFSVRFAKSIDESPMERVILRLMNDSRLEVRNLRIAEESHNHGVTDSFPPSAPTIRFIHNGSFEWFEKYWNLLSDARVVRSDDDFGNTALRLGKNGFVVQQSIHLLPKRKYRLIWYGKAAEENPGTLRLTLRYMPEKKLFHDQEYSLAPEAYQRYAVEFWTLDEPDPVMDLILKNEGDQPLLLAQFYLKEFSDEETAPLRIRLSEPHYRDAIYASMPCDAIRGVVEFDGDVTTAEVSFNGESITVTADHPHFEFSAESLTVGDHELVVSTEVDGEDKAVARKVIHKYPHRPNEVTIGKDRNFYCDGTRFFPFFMGFIYEDPEKPVMSYLCAMRGMNGCFTSGFGVPSRILQELDQAQRFGLKVMLAVGGDFAETDDYEEKLREQVAQILVPEILRHPALFAYNYCDEPWAREIPAYKFEAAERIFREIDPYHPLFINESPRGVVPEYLADYAKHSDIYGVDLYPIPAAVRHSAISDKSMAAVGKYSDLYNAAADDKPVLMWLQGYQWHEDSSPLAVLPNAHELKFMLLDALMHDTKAILIYNDKTVKQSYYADLFAVSGLASAYEPIIATGREVNSPLRLDGLAARAFELPGDDTYHLLLNETDRELAVDITVLGDAKPVFTEDSSLDGTTLTLRPWGFASFSVKGNVPMVEPLVEANDEFEAASGDFLETYLRAKFPHSLSVAEWIWYPGNVADNPKVSLDRELKFEKPVESVIITTTADNVLKLFLDGELVLESPDWFVIDKLDVTRLLKPEGSLLHLEAENQGGPAAIMMLIQVTYADGTQETIATDDTWLISNGENTVPAHSFGKVGYVRTWNWTLFENGKFQKF